MWVCIYYSFFIKLFETNFDLNNIKLYNSLYIYAKNATIQLYFQIVDVYLDEFIFEFQWIISLIFKFIHLRLRIFYDFL